MDRIEIFALMEANPVFHLATVDGNVPRVRAMLLYSADESGIVFHSGKSKDLHSQIMKNPNVELCFNDYARSIQVRVNGVVETVDDIAKKKEIIEKRQFLRPWVEEKGYEFLTVYRIRDMKAVVWTFATNLDPKQYIDL
ncbi:MAG: pyridoxamine 5'-phosphate oxidase family protein [Spirochaetes bacterium]|jgi:uncharacterized pyridoxamine 5'-phosphate oxidase family protein|nr:pyridoxamine 5'-phosphate oxidase family protein [Spirochaetota bacterium]